MKQTAPKPAKAGITALGPTTVIPRDPPVKVFTYGTLRPSLYPGAVARFGLTPLGRGVLYGHYEMLHLGGFPGLIQTPPGTHPDAGASIVGEVVEVADLRPLDRYEGYPSLYDRREVEIVMDDNTRATAWVYLFNNTPEHGPVDPNRARPVVTTGDWADIIATRH